MPKLVLIVELNVTFMSGVSWWTDQTLRKLKTVAKRAAQEAARGKIDVRVTYKGPENFETDEMLRIFPRICTGVNTWVWVKISWVEAKKYGISAPRVLERRMGKAVKTAVLEMERKPPYIVR